MAHRGDEECSHRILGIIYEGQKKDKIQKQMEWDLAPWLRSRSHERMRHRKKRRGSKCLSSLTNWLAIRLPVCHFWVSGKIAFVVHRTMSRMYRHHSHGEHRYSSHEEEHVGVIYQVTIGRPGRARQEDQGPVTWSRMFVQDVMGSLLDLLAACGPREILFFLKWPLSLEFKIPCLPVSFPSSLLRSEVLPPSSTPSVLMKQSLSKTHLEWPPSSME